jgi:hypothetical protein
MENAREGDQVGERQRGLMIVDHLPAAAEGHGKIGIRQGRLRLPTGRSERPQVERCTDDGAVAEVGQCKGGLSVPAVGGTDQVEQVYVVDNLQCLTRRFQKAVGHEIARECHDLPHEVDPARATAFGRENARGPDQVGDRQRRLIVVDGLGAAAQGARELRV